MASNVFEWTADWYDAYPGSKVKNTGYGRIYKVIRGGGFDAHAGDAGTVHRAVLPPRVRSEWAGFRCAKDADIGVAIPVAPNTPVAHEYSEHDSKNLSQSEFIHAGRKEINCHRRRYRWSGHSLPAGEEGSRGAAF
jgi:hypothetical protein